ncbi:GAF and ANTAR domain-containing protein [Saccharothrix saharensis]|uniref:GAF and ANTAR domain-containing protein n=1 Tax=Saccharothrix saharensis TaxID=571190 RepID=UPI00368D226C
MTRDQDVSVHALASELARMGRLIEDEEHEAVGRRFTEHLVRTVPGCDTAFLAVDRRGEVDIAASSGHPPPGLAADEADPVREVLRYREPRRLGDTARDHRWPLFASRLAEHGHRSCLVLPLPTERSPTAATVLLSRESHRFNDHSYDIIMLIALHAGIAMDNIEVLHHSKQMVRHLTTALDTRHTIGLAQGLLMRHFSHDTDQSFTLLRQASQHTNRKLRDIAHDLVTAHERGDFVEALTRHRITAAALP